jgi:hypothetical protein
MDTVRKRAAGDYEIRRAGTIQATQDATAERTGVMQTGNMIVFIDGQNLLRTIAEARQDAGGGIL